MPSKTAVRNLLRTIRSGDLQTVQEAIEADPALLHSRAASPPKRDDGQSPLQIAFKARQLEIARWLIERGADVNFQETSTVNKWTAPVLHDALLAAVALMPVLRRGDPGDRFETAVELLRLMLAQGADPNARDSYGKPCLHRVVADLNNWRGSFIGPERQAMYDEQAGACGAVLFSLLIEHGADARAADPGRKSAVETVRGTWLEEVLSEAMQRASQ